MENKKCVDPYGNEFESISKMLEHYNIAKVVYYRKIKEGVSIEDIIKNYARQNMIVRDHLGNEFKNQSELLKRYNISWTTFTYGIRHNKSIEEILTKKRHNSTDHTGRKFKTFREMCNYHNISINCVKRRLYDGWNLETALTTPQHRPQKLPKIIKNPKVLEILQVKKYISNNYFLCIFNNNEIVMHKKMLIQQAQEIINH